MHEIDPVRVTAPPGLLAGLGEERRRGVDVNGRGGPRVQEFVMDGPDPSADVQERRVPETARPYRLQKETGGLFGPAAMIPFQGASRPLASELLLGSLASTGGHAES